MTRPRDVRRPRGFTLIEMIVIMAVIGIAVLIGLPSLQELIHRSKMVGATRDTTTLMQRGRLESIRESAPALVQVDVNTNEVWAFVDADSSGAREAGEPFLMSFTLPSGVSLKAPSGQQAVEGFAFDDPIGTAVFLNDGSVEAAGAFRFGDFRDNFLEVRVAPRSTARIEIRKWNAVENAWQEQGEGGSQWQW